MFIYCYATIPVPFSSCEARLLALLSGLGDNAEVAYRQGEELRARLSPHGGMAKTVRLDVGEPIRSPADLRLPIVWEATGPAPLFPRMEAELVLSAVGDQVSHLSFQGTYRPPLGPIGRVLDRALLHRLAEASVKGFVDRLAAALSNATDLASVETGR